MAVRADDDAPAGHPTWLTPYLMQRLKPSWQGRTDPLRDEELKKMGTEKGGLLPWDRLFSADYMGSTEYEWGVYGQTVRSILATCDEYEAFAITLKKDDVNVEEFLRWGSPKAVKEYKKIGLPSGDVKLFVITKKVWRKETEDFLRALVKGAVRTRDGAHILDAIYPDPNPRNDGSFDIVGGLEETNGWLWTVKADLAEKVAKLLGVEWSKTSTTKD